MKAVKWVLILAVIAKFCWAAATPEAVQKVDIQIVMKGNNEFAFALFAKLREKQGNLFFSPYSGQFLIVNCFKKLFRYGK